MSQGPPNAGYRGVASWARRGVTRDTIGARMLFDIESHLKLLERGAGRVVAPGPSGGLASVVAGAPAGATLRLGEGTFSLSVSLARTSPIHIIGQGRATVLDFGDFNATGAVAFGAGSTGSTLSDVRIRYTAADRALLDMLASDIRIERVWFEAGTAPTAIVTVSANRCAVCDCVFSVDAAGANDIYFGDVTTNCVALSNIGSTNTNVINYKNGMTVATGGGSNVSNVGTVFVRP